MHRPIAVVSMMSLLALLHVGALIALSAFFSWQWLVLTLAAWQLLALVGISVFLHRELTHRAFRSCFALRLFHLTCALLAGQAGPVVWAGVHRAHHRHADTARDVHSPLEGFWAAHLGWIFQQHKRRAMADLAVAPPDIEGDRMVMLFDRIHFPAQVLIFGLLYLWQGWAAVCWLGCMRAVLTLHSAWAINSVGHMFGYRNHDTADRSRNCRLLALVTAGEGLHNNHHHTPRRANLAHAAGELDAGFAYVRLMHRLGLVSDLRA